MIDEAVTQKDRASAVMVNRVGDARLVGSEVHLPKGRAFTGPKKSREASDFTLARKVAGISKRRPYRKPTQVGEVRILRRTGEPLLRNSAK